MATFRFYAKVRRVSGEPTDRDPGSWTTDMNVTKHEVYYRQDKARERITATLNNHFGGKWEVVSLHFSNLRAGRR